MNETFNVSSRNGPILLSDATVTTAFELPGYRIVRNIGVVRGIIVRSNKF